MIVSKINCNGLTIQIILKNQGRVQVVSEGGSSTHKYTADSFKTGPPPIKYTQADKLSKLY